MPPNNPTYQLQKFLAGRGFPPGPIDGIPGAKTTAAVILYQRARGLMADGIVGPKTLAVMKRDGWAPTEQVGIDNGWAVHARPETIKPWLDYARSQIGVREIVGPKHSSTIMGWIRELGAKALGITVTDDETAWCGTFAGICILRGLPQEPLPAILVRAKAWLAFGVELSKPSVGAVMVYDRPGGGHVAFYLGEDDVFDHVVGGNQGNRVSIMRIEKARRSGIRWPKTVPMPTTGPVRLLASGEVSSNES